MALMPRFAAYAAAFEKAYASGDWSLLEPYFTDAAVYEVPDLAPPLGGRCEGRDAILAYFGRVIDAFDRRFASREIGLVAGPRESGDSVWLRGWAVYRAPGVPDLRFELEETAWFEGDRIRRLEDRYDPAAREALEAYRAAHGAKLGIGGG
jgi:hypothetical protein